MSRKNFLKKTKDILLAQKTELENKSYHIDIDIDGDETDEVQGKILANVNTQLSFRDKEKLIQIDNAIRKIENGEFGSCEDCSEEIAEKRLEINPYFSVCIRCAEQKERESKQRRGK